MLLQMRKIMPLWRKIRSCSGTLSGLTEGWHMPFRCPGYEKGISNPVRGTLYENTYRVLARHKLQLYTSQVGTRVRSTHINQNRDF